MKDWPYIALGVVCALAIGGMAGAYIVGYAHGEADGESLPARCVVATPPCGNGPNETACVPLKGFSQ